MTCPHCGDRVRVNGSRNISPTIVLRYRQCRRCGHRWVTTEVLTDTESPYMDNSPAQKR